MSPDPSSPQEGSRHTPAQRRVLTAVTGTAVAVVAAGSFAVTYDALRDLAVAGRVGERWAPVYPVMADVLLVVVVLALLVARHAPWWSRALRWLVLVALFAGGAALSVQHAVWGFASLPQDRLRAGVAVAPHAALVLAVWLWLTMIRHLRLPRPSGRIRPTPVEGAHVRIVERAEPERPPASPPPASLPTDVELVRDGHAPDAPEAPETSADHDADHNADDDTDELVPVTSATRPDLVPPPPATPADDDDDDVPAVDRAEDPDGGDADHGGRGRHRRGAGDTADDLPIWDWNPPSESLRSSPTPPGD
ncbi:DUF2637 domain-containing protein [Actinomadura namibiensis]|uniref:Protein-S-isoprenylcysteine O-methyltransferase Ste14 n=1 Tax=Actinomadura namibiensis TaxID=182080 RepID=A0A7W3LWQ6_ACTNM|nr:DUF2637 domain-containing protein [Actinomadura namibiensis]MBA8955671.1 protein-S-isoprenylcysteine O-methyltransferase Ste14 [Actinomadura namibiensis]